MRRSPLAALALLLLHGPLADDGVAGASKQPLVEIRSLSDRGVLTLADDRQVCLSGIWLEGDMLFRSQRQALKATFNELIDGRAVRIGSDDQPSYDRYGCRLAKVETEDGVLLQETLLERGRAIVKPDPSSRLSGEIDRWLAIEDKARRAGLGLWRDQRFKPKKAKAMTDHIGTISLVEGRVVRLSINDRYAYLNFGRDWRTDFTVRLRNKLLKQGGIAPGDLDGKRLRVRGFVQESRGPLIDISHLKQIEVMP